MFGPILETVSKRIAGARAIDYARHIHALDRWSSFDRYEAGARYCYDVMRGVGLEVELVPLLFDGETMHGDWIMPLAWDCRDATLTLLSAAGEPDRALCRYSEDPCSLVMHSCATAPKGVTAEIVVMEGGSAAADYGGVDVRGKVILTAQSPRTVKLEAVRHGAAGIISDCMDWGPKRPPWSLPASRSWIRFDADIPRGGWGPKKSDAEAWGFMLSPRQGSELRHQLRDRPGIRVHAYVDAHSYCGELSTVTGLLPGRTCEEVLIIGHLHEVGALDNASGAAVAIEVLRTLRELVDEGLLPRPRRGIRMIFTYECMGTMAIATRRPDLIGAGTVAGVNLDCVGGAQALTLAPLGQRRNPHAQTSYTDPLLWAIIEATLDDPTTLFAAQSQPFLMADNMIADPSIGVPCPGLLEYPYRDYHLSSDTPQILDAEALARVSAIVATYAYFIADAGQAHARWLGSRLLAEAIEAANAKANAVITDSEAASTATSRGLWRRLLYLQSRYDLAFRGLSRIEGTEQTARAASLSAELARAVGEAYRRATRLAGRGTALPQPDRLDRGRRSRTAVPVRVVKGPYQRGRIPVGELEAWDRACAERGHSSEVIFSALCWTDGRRRFGEIERLVEGETGQSGLELAGLFEGLEQYGYTAWADRA